MDYDNVIEDFCGDTWEIRKKLESFTEDCDFSALKVAVEEGDGENIRKRAHKVKKTGEKLGLSALVKAAAILEEAKNGKIASAFASLEKEYVTIADILDAGEEV